MEQRRIRTFLDTGVLFDAHRAGEPRRSFALELLNKPQRTFLVSPFLYLETAPKAIANRNVTETAFYRAYFDSPKTEWCHDLEAIVATARREAESVGLGAMDALHVSAAFLLQADEFLTNERPHRAIHRSRLVPIRFAYPTDL